MRPIVLSLLVLCVLALVGETPSRAQPAIPVPVLVDAGPAAPVTSDIATAPVAPPLVDPVAEPTKAVTVVKDELAEHGIAAGIVLALAMVTSALSKRAKKGSFLDRGSLPVYLASAAGVFVVLAGVLSQQLPWSALLPALLTGAAAALHPDPSAKAPVA